MVSGTAEGTPYAPVRIFAALVLVTGLFLSSAAVASGTAAPELEEPTATGTETPQEPEPTADPEPQETESPSPTPTDPTETPPEPTDEPPEVALEVNCPNGSLGPGETATVTCSASVSGATLTMGSTASALGGEVTISGNDVTYSAPPEYVGTGTDVFTVIATDIQGDAEASTSVTFTVYGTQPTPTPTETPTTEEPDLTHTEPPDTTSPEHTDPDPDPPQSTPPDAPRSSVSAPPPGAPSQIPEPSPGRVFLPMPGMPQLDELNLPGFGGSSSEPTSSPEPDEPPTENTQVENEDEGRLAETGSAAAYTAASLALLSIAAGALALRGSRRIV